MALKRSFLKGMGLTDEQVDSIIEAHSETVDGLKADLSKYKADSEKLPEIQKELDDLRSKGDGGFEQKWKDEHAAFEAYKKTTEEEKTTATKKAKLNDLLTESGIVRESCRSLIGKSYDLSKIELEADGSVKDKDALLTAIKTDYADFVGEVNNKSGAGNNNPPSGGGNKPLTRESIRGMSAAEINANWEEVSKVLAQK